MRGIGMDEGRGGRGEEAIPPSAREQCDTQGREPDAECEHTRFFVGKLLGSVIDIRSE